jgi:hypothetical protein
MNDTTSQLNQRLAALGLTVPEILLPRQSDLSQWAVIACDQFTQDRAYWDRVREAAGSSPSALNLIFPEVFLEDTGRHERIASIHRNMESYLANGIFSPPVKGCLYIERDTPLHKNRRGLIIAVDLECYDWTPDARPLIRSTEGTVPERLPPRMDIRRAAPLEIPHILLLIDDDTDSLLPSLGERAKRGAKQGAEKSPLYDSRLMLDSGSVRGWLLDSEDDLAFLAGSLEKLACRSETRYLPAGSGSAEEPFLFAMGDGNHSLASAKGIWEEYKKLHKGEAGLETHPCRYALVEIENIYDPAIEFEPIHRVIFGANTQALLGALAGLPGFTTSLAHDRIVRIETDAPGIAAASLQPLLDNFVQAGAGLSIDYIHGEDALFDVVEKSAKPAVGILLPPVKKSGLFETVARSGPLPRKSFSMGEAVEKRFYLECRRLFG